MCCKPWITGSTSATKKSSLSNSILLSHPKMSHNKKYQFFGNSFDFKCGLTIRLLLHDRIRCFRRHIAGWCDIFGHTSDCSKSGTENDSRDSSAADNHKHRAHCGDNSRVHRTNFLRVNGLASCAHVPTGPGRNCPWTLPQCSIHVSNDS